MGHTLGALLAAAGVLLASHASAQAPERFRFGWARAPGAETCAGDAAVRAEVTRRLGRDPFAPDATEVIEGILSREAGRWVARIYRRGPAGRTLGVRELASTAEGCDALGEASVLAVCLAIDPEAALSRAAAGADAGPQGAAGQDMARPGPPLESDTARHAADARCDEPARTQDAGGARASGRAVQGRGAPALNAPALNAPALNAPALNAPPPAGPASSAAVSLEVLGVRGLLPRIAAGVALRVEAGLGGRLRGSIGVMHLPEVRSREAAADFGFGLTAFSVGLCVEAWRAGIMGLDLCAASLIGDIQAVVHRPTPTDPGARLWAGVEGRARLSVDLGRTLWLGATGWLTLPLIRHRFRVEGVGRPVFQQDIVAPGLSLALGAHFP